MFRFKMDHLTPRVANLALAWLVVLVVLGASSAPTVLAAREDPRDFPPLVDPNRPDSVEPVASPTVVPVVVASEPPSGEAEPEDYLLGVGDEVQVNVLAAPELSGLAKVRPDGAITIRGAGTIHALGRTPEDVGREIEERLGAILRHVRVDLAVTDFGDSRVFVMGDVELPGDKPYNKGMTALQAVGAAGGIGRMGKSGSVLVLRRTGTDAAEVRCVDLGRCLKGEPGPDVVLHPYDIVFVPRTFIGRADVAVEQYVRAMISPFTLYLEGWKAVSVGTNKYRFVATP